MPAGDALHTREAARRLVRGSSGVGGPYMDVAALVCSLLDESAEATGAGPRLAGT